jgi:hypothetical protein
MGALKNCWWSIFSASKDSESFELVLELGAEVEEESWSDTPTG